MEKSPTTAFAGPAISSRWIGMLVRCFAHSHYNNAVIRGQSHGRFALPTPLRTCGLCDHPVRAVPRKKWRRKRGL